PFYQDPLFAYLLAGLMALVGPGFAALRIALACVGSLTPLAVFWAGRKGLGRAEGIVAGLVTAVYRPLIFNDGLLEKEGVGALVAALALGLTARAAAPEREGRGVGVAGFAWGVLALLRANALLVGPLGVAWCLWTFGARGGRGPGLRRALAFSSGFGIAVAPAIVINAVVADPPELLLTTWQAGANFYIGNGPEARGNYTKLPFVIDNPSFEADNFMSEARRRTGRRLSPGEVSRFWFHEGLRRWETDPVDSVRLLAWKLALLANDFEIFDNQSEELVRSVVAPALGWGFLSFGWLLPWAALGLARERADRTPFWWFLALSTLGGLLSTAVFFVVGRYRIPWIPGLALLAAAGGVDAARRLASGRWKGLAWRVGLLALPAAILAWAPTAASLTPERWSLFYVKMITAYDVAGRLDEALDAMDDARALDPRMADYLHSTLDSSLAREQKLRLSREVARLVAAERMHDDAESTLRIIRWLRLLPDGPGREESRRLLEEALETHPDDPRLHRELGAWWLGDRNDPDARRRAKEELDRASRGPAGDPSAAILFALVSGDPRQLERPSLHRLGRDSTRLRMARASLAAGKSIAATIDRTAPESR
ncbi:MAG: hypothetical protein QOE66_652, partial [Chloroflexota bacterium]|nr:hypothetical protein [Chloroflexota bacterium]